MKARLNGQLKKLYRVNDVFGAPLHVRLMVDQWSTTLFHPSPPKFIDFVSILLDSYTPGLSNWQGRCATVCLGHRRGQKPRLSISESNRAYSSLPLVLNQTWRTDIERRKTILESSIRAGLYLGRREVRAFSYSYNYRRFFQWHIILARTLCYNRFDRTRSPTKCAFNVKNNSGSLCVVEASRTYLLCKRECRELHAWWSISRYLTFSL